MKNKKIKSKKKNIIKKGSSLKRQKNNNKSITLKKNQKKKINKGGSNHYSNSNFGLSNNESNSNFELSNNKSNSNYNSNFENGNENNNKRNNELSIPNNNGNENNNSGYISEIIDVDFLPPGINIVKHTIIDESGWEKIYKELHNEDKWIKEKGPRYRLILNKNNTSPVKRVQDFIKKPDKEEGKFQYPLLNNFLKKEVIPNSYDTFKNLRGSTQELSTDVDNDKKYGASIWKHTNSDTRCQKMELKWHQDGFQPEESGPYVLGFTYLYQNGGVSINEFVSITDEYRNILRGLISNSFKVKLDLNKEINNLDKWHSTQQYIYRVEQYKDKILLMRYHEGDKMNAKIQLERNENTIYTVYLDNINFKHTADVDCGDGKRIIMVSNIWSP